MSLDTLMSASVLIPVAVFGAIVLLLFSISSWFTSGETQAEERLDKISDPNHRKREASDLVLKQNDVVTDFLEKNSSAFSKPLQPKTEEQESALKTKLIHAGFRSEAAPTIYLSIKLIAGVLGFFLGGGAGYLSYGFSTDALILLLAAAGLMFSAPDLVVWFITRQRKEAIFLSLPDILDLMVVCVEAGLGLDQAMARVSEEMKTTHPVLSKEIATANFHLQVGHPRQQVLFELGQRTGVDDMISLSAVLVQADKFGSSIAQALRVQSDSMRTRRKQIAEEKAAKTAVTLLFPMVLFIFPGIFVVLVGPAAITMIKEMLPTMAGG